MKLKQLEGLLGELTQFPEPKVELEQYPTGPHIASRMLYTVSVVLHRAPIPMLSCSFGQVIGVDIDPQSLELAQENADELELDIDLIWSDIKNLSLKGVLIDTVVMNPPFGTRRKGADMEFLSVGLKVASQAVYSLHKTSTREHIKKTALRDCGAINAEVLCEVITCLCCAMICRRHTNSTRKRRSTLLSICGALFRKPDTAASTMRPDDGTTRCEVRKTELVSFDGWNR
ncbi:hypothetical protein EJB05_46071 [Eragrostis curvula]|uniref:Ribosomal RNA large subunit methyltransferase K/L-like methyltransferase domain-containing protein n=1 Tax=Eragrostis curvula TaxID=38414 RepID=A0A5J9TMJ9_9POAL|nr:hypothetical protein EJB05_46071 [Eragrostis curvula]